MNRITDQMLTGTIGELLVQLRLLEHDVQAAPPIKDSGNDLIAVKGECFRAIQVKTTTRDEFDKGNLGRLFHILAVVQLVDDDNTIYLDQSPVFLIPRDQVDHVRNRVSELGPFRMNRDHVAALFR